MKYREDGFRSFDRSYVAVPVTEKLRKIIHAFPGAKEAEYILTYGYIDHEAGMTLEVLAAAARTGKGFRFWDQNNEITVKIRIGSIADLECYYLDDDEGKLYGWYKEKVDDLSVYDVDDDVKVSRGMGFLDEFREPYFPDDVLVHLFREENQPEGCWVRIEGLDEENRRFLGTLLNEPTQKLGCHAGDRISFFFYEVEKNQHFLCADLDEDGTVTPAEREDMTLEEAIQVFHEDSSKENGFRVLRVLAYSTVLIPCDATFSDVDMMPLWNLLKTKEKDLEGETIESQDNIHLTPKILHRDGESFIPIFSSTEAMKDYGKTASILEKPFMEVLSMVQHSSKKLAGIVVNPFTQSFLVPMELIGEEGEE